MSSEERLVRINSGDNTKRESDGLHIECPFCSEWLQHHHGLHDGCDCGASLITGVRYDTGDNSEFLRINVEESHVENKTGEKGMNIQCPFCSTWMDSGELLSGCECGAEATYMTKFIR